MSPRRSSSLRFALPLLLQLVLAVHPTTFGKDTSGMTYQIKTTWDGLPVDHDPVSITLVGRKEGVEIQVDAPFFGIPGNPGGEPGAPFDHLWNYEVVEVFFSDGNVDRPKYVEIELCPWGQHLVLLLDGVHNAVKTLLPLQFEATINSGRWKGRALVPSSYFPPGVTRFNAYAIHDVEHNAVDDPRRYESLFPTPTNKYPSADFHRLQYFQTLDFEALQPGNKNATLSDPWPQDIEMSMLQSTRIATTEVTAKYYLFGGAPATENTTSMTATGVTEGESARIDIVAKGFLHEGAASMGGASGDPLPDENLDKYETMRFYLANEKRRILEIIFCPNGRYDVKMFEEPYKRVSRGLRLSNVIVQSDVELQTWNVTATVPLELIPQNLTRVALSAIYGGENGTVYETSYYVTNAGICLPDLYVVKLYPQVTGMTLLDPALNGGYSDLWGLNDDTSE